MSLQHAATRCNTLQHTLSQIALHYHTNTKKNTQCVAYCNTLQYTLTTNSKDHSVLYSAHTAINTVCCKNKCVAYCTHCNIHLSPTRKMPQTEEIGLKIIATAKISNKTTRFHESPRTYQTHSSRKLCKSETFVCTRVE